jgi:hypothetical protein
VCVCVCVHERTYCLRNLLHLRIITVFISLLSRAATDIRHRPLHNHTPPHRFAPPSAPTAATTKLTDSQAGSHWESSCFKLLLTYSQFISSKVESSWCHRTEADYIPSYEPRLVVVRDIILAPQFRNLRQLKFKLWYTETWHGYKQRKLL